MKFEFSMDVKGVPTARVDCKFECSPEELVTLISDPVYQGLGQKFINEVSFAPKAQQVKEPEVRVLKTFKPQPKQDTSAVVEELCSRVNSLLASIKKEREAERKAMQVHMDIMHKAAERTQKF